MEHSLSSGEIADYLKNKKIVLYGEITKYRNAADLVYPKNECVILYKTANNYGHWTCLLKNKHGYEFYDPYGVMLDDELDYPVQSEGEDEDIFKFRNGQDRRYLTMLLAQVREPVSYNHFKFQSFKRKDGTRPTTCGRHVILRLLNKHMSLQEFKKEFDSTLTNLKSFGEFSNREFDDEYTYDNAVVDLIDI